MGFMARVICKMSLASSATRSWVQHWSLQSRWDSRTSCQRAMVFNRWDECAIGSTGGRGRERVGARSPVRVAHRGRHDERRRACEHARLPWRHRDAEGGRAVYRLARDGRGKSGQRKKRAGGQGGGRSGHANDEAMDQVASVAASVLGEIKQQAASSAATLVGTARAGPWPSPPS